jgi:3-oxoadipate enol-lactonase
MPYLHTSDGIRLRYEVHGPRHGEPLLMVQGLGADSRGWTAQRLHFARRYRVITFDNRGVGRSDKPMGSYDLARMALDATEVLDDAGVDAAHVMGASMGGIVAQILAVEHPDRVRSLVLACTACRHQPWRRVLLTEWAELARDRGMRAFAAENLRWLVGPRSLRRFWPAFTALSSVFISAPQHAFIAQVRAILAIDDEVAARLTTVAAPTLVIVGSQDILTPQADSEEIAELIPGAELAIVRGGAHGFMIEAAGPFNRAVGEFLERVVLERAGAPVGSPCPPESPALDSRAGGPIGPAVS